MSFRKLDLSSLGQPHDPPPENDGVTQPTTDAPELRSGFFPTEEDAMRFYQGLINDPTVAPSKPRIGGADAIRVSDQVLRQVKKDWVLLQSLLSAEEQQHCQDAYYHLTGLRMAWLFVDKTVNNKQGGDETDFLQDARELRETLLSLATAAYKPHAEILKKLDQIRALSRPGNSMYDECAVDLLDVVAIFSQNPFQTQGYVTYPTELLQKATTTATKLTLLAPNKKTSSIPDKELSLYKDALITHRAFGLFEACMERLVSAGRFLHFGKPQAAALYPLLTAPRNPSKDSSPGSQDGDSATIPDHRSNFG